jgi:hypothetical protein
MADLSAIVNCPVCGFEITGAAELRGRTLDETVGPIPGSVMVCGGCAAPLVYLAYGGLRRMTAQEEIALTNEQRAKLDMAQAAVKMATGGRRLP